MLLGVLDGMDDEAVHRVDDEAGSAVRGAMVGRDRHDLAVSRVEYAAVLRAIAAEADHA